MGITIVFILFLVVLSLGVFSSKPNGPSGALVFNKPKVNIDMRVFDSDQFKNLQPLIEMQTQYSYTATTQDKQLQTGFISATSVDQARTILIGMGLSVTGIKEAQIGRDNPFTPYYQPIITPVPIVKSATTNKTATTTTKTTAK